MKCKCKESVLTIIINESIVLTISAPSGCPAVLYALMISVIKYKSAEVEDKENKMIDGFYRRLILNSLVDEYAYIQNAMMVRMEVIE